LNRTCQDIFLGGYYHGGKRQCPFDPGDAPCANWCPLFKDGRCAFERIAEALENNIGAKNRLAALENNIGAKNRLAALEDMIRHLR